MPVGQINSPIAETSRYHSSTPRRSQPGLNPRKRPSSPPKLSTYHSSIQCELSSSRLPLKADPKPVGIFQIHLFHPVPGNFRLRDIDTFRAKIFISAIDIRTPDEETCVLMR